MYGQDLTGRLAEVSNKARPRNDRREFFAQTAAIVVAAATPLCCGCQPKTSSGIVGDSTADGVEQRVIDIVAEQMGVLRDKIQRTTRFKEDLGADSLNTVELVMEFEEEFEISIPDTIAEKISTVGQAIDCVAKLVGDRPAPPRKNRRKPRALGSGSGDRPTKDLDRQKR